MSKPELNPVHPPIDSPGFARRNIIAAYIEKIIETNEVPHDNSVFDWYSPEAA